MRKWSVKYGWRSSFDVSMAVWKIVCLFAFYAVWIYSIFFALTIVCLSTSISQTHSAVSFLLLIWSIMHKLFSYCIFLLRAPNSLEIVHLVYGTSKIQTVFFLHRIKYALCTSIASSSSLNTICMFCSWF